MASNPPEETSKETQEAPSGGKKKIVIIAAAVVLVVAVAAGLFFSGVFGGKEGSEPAKEEPIEVKLPTLARPTVPLKEFVINLADVDQSRYLKAVVELEVANEEVAQACEANRAAIRNSLVELLSSKAFAQIRDVKGKVRLRQDIIVRLNEILGTNWITQVYFTDFIVQ